MLIYPYKQFDRLTKQTGTSTILFFFFASPFSKLGIWEEIRTRCIHHFLRIFFKIWLLHIQGFSYLHIKSITGQLQKSGQSEVTYCAQCTPQQHEDQVKSAPIAGVAKKSDAQNMTLKKSALIQVSNHQLRTAVKQVKIVQIQLKCFVLQKVKVRFALSLVGNFFEKNDFSDKTTFSSQAFISTPIRQRDDAIFNV